eukprot:TRINITY_DN2752_c1_g3_i1.p1 TRINITY_DN2752_c1_g3~~TRINITY_DN2752_c1_g3_i1.p1  ORF type:complete len:504 (+),score=119.17 TRINITY_DN2752_c1_g3_i1:29-1513(+)
MKVFVPLLTLISVCLAATVQKFTGTSLTLTSYYSSNAFGSYSSYGYDAVVAAGTTYWAYMLPNSNGYYGVQVYSLSGYAQCYISASYDIVYAKPALHNGKIAIMRRNGLYTYNILGSGVCSTYAYKTISPSYTYYVGGVSIDTVTGYFYGYLQTSPSSLTGGQIFYQKSTYATTHSSSSFSGRVVGLQGNSFIIIASGAIPYIQLRIYNSGIYSSKLSGSSSTYTSIIRATITTNYVVCITSSYYYLFTVEPSIVLVKQLASATNINYMSSLIGLSNDRFLYGLPDNVQLVSVSSATGFINTNTYTSNNNDPYDTGFGSAIAVGSKTVILESHETSSRTHDLNCVGPQFWIGDNIASAYSHYVFLSTGGVSAGGIIVVVIIIAVIGGCCFGGFRKFNSNKHAHANTISVTQQPVGGMGQPMGMNQPPMGQMGQMGQPMGMNQPPMGMNNQQMGMNMGQPMGMSQNMGQMGQMGQPMGNQPSYQPNMGTYNPPMY